MGCDKSTSPTSAAKSGVTGMIVTLMALPLPA
jgi:hypothetical protein